MQCTYIQCTYKYALHCWVSFYAVHHNNPLNTHLPNQQQDEQGNAPTPNEHCL